MIPFSKAHGLGNDFVILRSADCDPTGLKIPEIARRLCHRKFGIGADGLIVVGDGPNGWPSVQIINADGSEAGMCGNGLRSFALWFCTQRGSLGELQIWLNQGLYCAFVESASKIRVTMPTARVIGAEEVDGLGTALRVDVKNPHLVFFVDQIPQMSQSIGDACVRHDANLHFARLLSEGEFEMRTWERGVGPTAACGSGACSVVAAAQHNGISGPVANIHLEFGVMRVCAAHNVSLIEGPALLVAEGTIDPNQVISAI